MQKLYNWLDGGIKYLLAAVMLAVPLYPKFPFIKIPGTYVSVRLEDFLVVALGLTLVIQIFPRLKEFLTDRVNREISGLPLVGLVSFAFGHTYYQNCHSKYRTVALG